MRFVLLSELGDVINGGRDGPGLQLRRGVSPTKVRKVPQDSCQLPERKGFSAIPELPGRDLV